MRSAAYGVLMFVYVAAALVVVRCVAWLVADVRGWLRRRRRPPAFVQRLDDYRDRRFGGAA